ncbi:MAG: ABC transporter ATP-binding protein [Eubacteriaceae bacterium]|nr:ABC transporter ATP-binding protein [Eubacteriaceae bacterium]
MSAVLEVKDLGVSFGDYSIVRNVSFTVNEGEWVILAGPNGAGKSTVVNAVSKLTDFTGTVLLSGRDIRGIKHTEFARTVSVLSQYHYVSYPFTVREVVSLGRYSHTKGFLNSSSDEQGEEFIEKAMEETGVSHLADKSVLQLSGGELQRTFLAQIFAQDPKLLILDEPTNHLDLVYQKQIFELIGRWIKGSGRAVVAVVHDLSLAKANGTHAVLMNRGEIVTRGPIHEVFSRENLNSVYQLDVYKWMKEMYSQWDEQ